MVSGSASKQVLLAATYLLYIIMYEEKYAFNPNNQVTFVEITEIVERYGEDTLIKNL
jgi:hypothetical protein